MAIIIRHFGQHFAGPGFRPRKSATGTTSKYMPRRGPQVPGSVRRSWSRLAAAA